jgi:chromosome segregation ATPase
MSRRLSFLLIALGVDVSSCNSIGVNALLSSASSSAAATTTTVATTCAAGASSFTTRSTIATVSSVRGGGWFFFGSSRVEDRYRKSLEDQIQILERQVRAAREETTQLRKLAKLTAGNSIAYGTGMTATLKEEIAMLQKQISQLENFKQELELLLKEEQQRSADLQAKLETAGANALELHNQHLLAMEELEKKMLERAKKQLEELNALMDVRIKEAAGKARRDALQEMDQKISEAVSKVEAKAKAELEDERQKAADAVEKERAKMRKLVKALAEREKKASDKASGKATVATSSRKQPATPTSVRSPIKNT